MRRIIAVMLTAALVGLGLATAAAALVHMGNDNGAASSIFSATNSQRSSAGLHALQRDSSLDKAARDWSKKMAEANSLSHNPNVSSQIRGGWRSWGENVAYNQPGSASGIMSSWMGSSGHKANILSKSFTHIGVGVYVDDNNKMWATQVFAQYGDPPSAPKPEPTKTTAAPKPSPTTTAPKPTTPAPTTTPPPEPTPTETEEPTLEPTPEPTPTSEPTPSRTATPTPSASTDAMPLTSADGQDGSPVAPWIVGGSVLLAVGAAVGAFMWQRRSQG